jgi:flagellar motor protein MotB
MADDHKEHGDHGGKDAHGDHGGGGGHGGGGHGGGHGGGGHEEHEGAPEWLISFADNVALMMGFFVILLAMNMQKPAMGGVGGEGKYPSDVPPEMEDFAIALREAFHNEVDINSTDPHEQSLVRRKREVQSQGGHTRTTGPDGNKSTVQAPRTSSFYQTFGAAYFNEFETTLSDEGRRSIAQMADALRGQQWIIEVRGHASAVESNGNPDRATTLSYERAHVVAQQLVKEGLHRELIRVVACSDNERETARATSPEQHRSNQRVEIFTTQETMPEDPYKAHALQGDDERDGGH